jgi:4'-phosphopantetheinyl transferase
VHLWRADLNRIDRPAHGASPDEAAVAATFRSATHARWFLARRVVRRRVLARYLGILPERVEYRVGPAGRPELASGSTNEMLSFNASSSQADALLALTTGGAVGVDIEIVRAVPDVREIARRFFHLAECLAIEAQTTEQARLELFYRCWTRKEAVVKSIGDGLSFPLSGFAVDTGADGGPTQISFVGAPRRGPVFVQGLTLSSDRVAAIALDRSLESIERWTLDPAQQPFGSYRSGGVFQRTRPIRDSHRQSAAWQSGFPAPCTGACRRSVSVSS